MWCETLASPGDLRKMKPLALTCIRQYFSRIPYHLEKDSGGCMGSAGNSLGLGASSAPHYVAENLHQFEGSISL